MSVTFASGFQACGISAGLKSSGYSDLALVVNLGPKYACGATYTTNRFRAAPVLVSEVALKESQGLVRAVVVNSGSANACTGEIGLEHAQIMAKVTAEKLDIPRNQVQICSTGKISQQLEIDKVLSGIDVAVTALSDSDQAGQDAAMAICTTDTVLKTAVVQANGYRIGGMVKGAGMIAPEMATMICVITTDSSIPESELQSLVNQSVNMSFNRLDSDGCMSTNDTVLVLANGASGVRANSAEFLTHLTSLMQSLAKQIIQDAEGASHDVLIRVVNASSETAGLAVARAISRSNLLKSALSGNDPNWGRILAAAGTVSEAVAPFNPTHVDVVLNDVMVSAGSAIGVQNLAVDLLAEREITIEIDLKSGVETVEVWTNDLTKRYVEINGEYST